MNDTYIITKDKNSYQITTIDVMLYSRYVFENQTILKVFDAEDVDAAKEIYEIVIKKDIKANRKPVISHKGFVRGAKYFQRLALKEIDSWSDDKDFKERFDSEANYILKKSIEKLIQTNKSKPYKRKSAFTNSITSFRSIDDVVKEIRISYTLTDEKLTFKLLTRTKSRFKRKCQFVINL